MLGALLCLACFAFGCQGDGSSGSTEGSTAVGSTVVDLPPGQTTVQLAWVPSEGNVDGYLTFRSDNQEAFQYIATVAHPTIEISGEPGDSVRLLVIGLGATGVYSAPSPPSAPIRFHAAVAAVEAAPLTASSAPTPLARDAGAAASASASDAIAGSDALASEDGAGSSERESTSGSEASATSQTVALDLELLDLLLRGNLRLPLAGLTSNADDWVQTFVDAELAAGVSLVGAGDFDADDLRDLVWRDAAGQLFLSRGARLLQERQQGEDLSISMEETLRLGPSEVFVALADFGRDGVGDWLLEDSATGEVSIIDGASHETIFAGPDANASASRLLAYGDFDADGYPELLWRRDDRSLTMTHPEGDLPTHPWSSDALESIDIVAVADLDGDGRDDLLAQGDDGQLEFGLSIATADGLGFEWGPAAQSSTEGLDLLAILDLEQDGTTEIAWLNGDSVEIWDAMTGPRP